MVFLKNQVFVRKNDGEKLKPTIDNMGTLRHREKASDRRFFSCNINKNPGCDS